MARTAFVHDAVVALQPGGSPNAPGGAITLALCSSWDHPPPCPLAPHHVAHSPNGDTVTLRVLFAVEPVHEQQVRAVIGDALAAGNLRGPDGQLTAWEVRSHSRGEIRDDELDHAAQLAAH